MERDLGPEMVTEQKTNDDKPIRRAPADSLSGGVHSQKTSKPEDSSAIMLPTGWKQFRGDGHVYSAQKHCQFERSHCRRGRRLLGSHHAWCDAPGMVPRHAQ